MRHLLLIFAASTVAVVASFSTAFGASLSLSFENDAFYPGAGDHDYTHGTCIEFISDNFVHAKVGQNMYAPSNLKRSDHIVGDRPYAGIIYGGIGYEFFRDPSSSWTHYGEIDFGMIGPAAGCEHTQKFIHKILNCRDPKGWSNQLRNEFVVNGQWWTKYNWYLCKYVAVVPRVGVLAGTIQDAIEVGCDLKIGWNMHNDVGNNLMFSASKDQLDSFLSKLTAYAYVGVDERYYLYNHFLEGSMFGHKDDGLDVDIERFVGEAQAGLCIKYSRFTFKYYMVFRQDEFKHQKHSPNYAGLSFGIDF